MNDTASNLRAFIRDVPDFPKEGILFRDFTPLLEDAKAFAEAIDWLASFVKGTGVSKIVGIESRGFILGAALASKMGLGLSLVRKRGKLPSKTFSVEYALEYGTDEVQLHVDSLNSNDKVVIVDDLLATGGTAEAAVSLCEMSGAKVERALFLIELQALKGRDRLDSVNVECLIQYP